MGDRTWATTTFRKNQYNKHEKEIKKIIKDYGYQVDDSMDNTIELQDDQANYGNMDGITDFLDEKEIEYDLKWEAGGDYGPGTRYARKVGNEFKTHEIADVDDEITGTVRAILEIATKDGATLEDVIADLNTRIQNNYPFEVKDLGYSQAIEFIKEA